MNFETMEIWDAMKEVKYSRTMENLRVVIENARGNLDEAIATVLDMVCAAVHAEAGVFWFYSRFGDGMLHPRAWHGTVNMEEQFRLPGEGIAGKVVETGKPLMIADCDADPTATKKLDRMMGSHTQSILCVPLISDELVYGCIQLINKNDGTLFDKKDMKFALHMTAEISEQFVSMNLLSDGRIEPHIVVLFAELRGFSKIAANMEPDRVAELLNAYFAYVTSCIRKNHGTPDKYIGDSAMAYWGADMTGEDPVYSACRAAMDMMEGAADLEKRMWKQFGCKVRFGISLNYGPAYLGNVGTALLVDHTVVGETVNTASRLEGVTPAGKIYITRSVAEALGKRGETTRVRVKTKGKLFAQEVFCLQKMQ